MTEPTDLPPVPSGSARDAVCTSAVLAGAVSHAQSESDAVRLLIQPAVLGTSAGCGIGPPVEAVDVRTDQTWRTLSSTDPPYTLVPAGLGAATSTNFAVALWFDRCDSTDTSAIEALRLQLANHVTIDVPDLASADVDSSGQRLCADNDQVRTTDVFTYSGYG